MKTIKTLLLTLPALALLFAARPASAWSDYCATDAFPAFIINCDAGPIPANSSGHFVRYEVSSFMKYWFKDSNNGVILRYGNAGWSGKRETVFGLYSWYLVSVKGVGGYAYINNT
jgi:hypothetical protein